MFGRVDEVEVEEELRDAEAEGETETAPPSPGPPVAAAVAVPTPSFLKQRPPPILSAAAVDALLNDDPISDVSSEGPPSPTTPPAGSGQPAFSFLRPRAPPVLSAAAVAAMLDDDATPTAATLSSLAAADAGLSTSSFLTRPQGMAPAAGSFMIPKRTFALPPVKNPANRQ